ncbi:MAG: hypothetical protein OHK0023_24530 [Anaerolineae bacterium]
MSVKPYLLSSTQSAPDEYPYRRVWRTAWLEAIVLVAITSAITLGSRIVPLEFSQNNERLFGIAFALLPLGLWVVISYRAERAARMSRSRLMTVVILGGLAASGVAIPVIDQFFVSEEWLTNASGITRIVGYTLSVGLVHEFLKYAVVRYSVWRDLIETRQDAVAYSLACGVGFGTALTVHFALNNTLHPAAAALRITEIFTAQVAIAPIMGYVLYEMRNPKVFTLLPAFGLMIASLFNALSIVIRAGLIVSGISRTSTSNNALFGLGMVVFIVVVLYSALGFIIRSADERDILRSGLGG